MAFMHCQRSIFVLYRGFEYRNTAELDATLGKFTIHRLENLPSSAHSPVTSEKLDSLLLEDRKDAEDGQGFSHQTQSPSRR